MGFMEEARIMRVCALARERFKLRGWDLRVWGKQIVNEARQGFEIGEDLRYSEWDYSEGVVLV